MQNCKIKKHYKTRYTQIDNILVNDMELSFQAKGLFLYIWSKPNDWQVNVKAMQYHCIDKQTKIYSALKELETRGYLIRKRYYENGKVAGINYNFSDTKEFFFDQDELNQENLNQVELNEENQNEYIYIQKKDNTKERLLQKKDNTNLASGFSNKKEIPVVKESLATQSVEVEVIKKAKRFQKPTITEILEYANDLCKKENIKLANLTIEMKNFFDFYEQKDWKVGNTKMKEWKLAVNRWVRGNAVKEQGKQPKTEFQKLIQKPTYEVSEEIKEKINDAEKRRQNILEKMNDTEKAELKYFQTILLNYFPHGFATLIEQLVLRVQGNKYYFGIMHEALLKQKDKIEVVFKRERPKAEFEIKLI